MKRTLLLISVITVLVPLLGAQDAVAFKTAMQSVDVSAGRTGPLRAAVAAKDVAAAAAEGKKIQAAFDIMLAYWTANKVDDAIKFSIAARDAAKTIAESNDVAAQDAAMTTLNGTCVPCHMPHRGGTRPNYEIK